MNRSGAGAVLRRSPRYEGPALPIEETLVWELDAPAPGAGDAIVISPARSLPAGEAGTAECRESARWTPSPAGTVDRLPRVSGLGIS
ncbi:MAG TPA: hypothetical protein VMD78_15310 [Candidatus Baltobacteraceae bacterium]|nr:hypothetical protein [Candidatus Baltobacteraceae bacterium]